MTRLGIFGGSFNPPHIGHINSVESVKKNLGLDKVFILPTAQSPLKPVIDGAETSDRLEMVKRAFQDYGESFIVDDREIKRGGVSYTVETLKSYAKENPEAELYLIVGMDKFEELPAWKALPEILNLANLVVTTRPGTFAPLGVEDFPPAIAEMVDEFTSPIALLKTGKSIQFVPLKDVDISGTEVRKKVRTRQQLDRFLPLSVESYIIENDLYRPMGSKIESFEQLTRFCGQQLFERKAINVRGFDLRDLEAPTEFTLVASGTSTRHAKSLAELLQKAVKEEYGVAPQAVEGQGEGRWVVLDYGSLIVHIFYDFVRMEYNLENLWRDAKDMRLVDTAPQVQSTEV